MAAAATALTEHCVQSKNLPKQRQRSQQRSDDKVGPEQPCRHRRAPTDCQRGGSLTGPRGWLRTRTGRTGRPITAGNRMCKVCKPSKPTQQLRRARGSASMIVALSIPPISHDLRRTAAADRASALTELRIVILRRLAGEGLSGCAVLRA